MEYLLAELDEIWKSRDTIPDNEKEGYYEIILNDSDKEFIDKLSDRLFSRKYRKFNVVFASHLEACGYEVYFNKTNSVSISIYKRRKTLHVI